MSAILLLQTEPAASAAAPGLTPFAWAFMLVSMGSVILLTLWCFTRILRRKEHFDPDGTGPAAPPVPGRVDERGGA